MLTFLNMRRRVYCRGGELLFFRNNFFFQFFLLTPGKELLKLNHEYRLAPNHNGVQRDLSNSYISEPGRGNVRGAQGAASPSSFPRRIRNLL